jgi:hypothetical protein
VTGSRLTVDGEGRKVVVCDDGHRYKIVDPLSLSMCG